MRARAMLVPMPWASISNLSTLFLSKLLAELSSLIAPVDLPLTPTRSIHTLESVPDPLTSAVVIVTIYRLLLSAAPAACSASSLLV